MDARRQLKSRLQSLKEAGVEYLPRPRRRPASPAAAAAPPPINPEAAFVAEVHAAVGEERRKSLDVLAREVAACSKCPELFSTRTQTVFGVGPLSPELCFVGEAPGADEDAKGEPFVGRAGQLLNDIIRAMGLERSQVYICNTLKCRPPNNATPTPQQCENCRPFFERQIDLVKPKWICCLGAVAAKNVLATETGITKLRGKLHEYRGIPVLATYHPAYLLRNPPAKRDVWDDMKFLLKQMGREIPKQSKHST